MLTASYPSTRTSSLTRRRSCNGFRLSGVLLYAGAAVASGSAACSAGYDADGSALMQRGPPRVLAEGAGVGKEVLKWGKVRVLTTITEQPNFTIGGVQVVVRSVVPVFPPDGKDPYMAFVTNFDEEAWLKLNSTDSGLACTSGERPGFSSPVEAFGGDVWDRIYWSRWTAVLKCAWPAEWRHRRCHDVRLADHGEETGKYQTCHDPELAQEGSRYDLAACVAPVWDDPKLPQSSGAMMLPQWLEYNVQRGVQHFLVYTTMETDERQYAVLRPFLDAGLMTQIRLDVGPLVPLHGPEKTQQLVINDCLHRMRGRTTWLMTSSDVDEYNVFPSAPRGEPLHESLRAAVGDRSVHAVTYGFLQFLHPDMPYENLQISSELREAEIPNICPKLFVRPDLVECMFVHWPMAAARGTKNLALPSANLSTQHYRRTRPEVDIDNVTVDRRLTHEVRDLDAALTRRYGQPWRAWAPRLMPPGWDGEARAEEGAMVQVDRLEARPGAQALVRFMAGLREPAFIEGMFWNVAG